MQFRILRKSHRKEIIIGGLIILCVISAITITTTRAKYKLTEDIPLARGTINYTPDKEKPIITNVETSVTKTEINITVSATDNVGVTEYWYQIDNNTPVKGTGNTHKFTGLSAGTTHTIKVYVKDAKGNQSDTTEKSVQTTPNTASETILGNITIATAGDGVYKMTDGMYRGTSYYWKGAVTDNYVKFANYCWRIIRINGDRTIRLIYAGSSCQANGTKTSASIARKEVPYSRNYYNSEDVGWTYSRGIQRTLNGTDSNAKTQLESWYKGIENNTLYSTKVADGKFCNDREVVGTYWASVPNRTFSYAAYDRERTSAPTLSCFKGDIYTLKVGLITADEALLAGVFDTVGLHNNNYLYNGQYYWTMTPYCVYYTSSSTTVYVYRINGDGNLDDMGVSNSGTGLRPVINLKSDVTFSSGNGTLDNPYVVS